MLPTIIRYVFAFLTLAAPLAAVAQESYPSKPVKVVVPFPPGGGTDFIGRTVSKMLGDRLGKQLVVDNRPGASGSIGTDIVARATPDGYTLLIGDVGALVTTPLLQTVPYNPITDLAPVSLVASLYHVLVAHPSVPASSISELIRLAKKNPGRLNFASSGGGSNLYLIMEIFKRTTGIDVTHVPYKGVGPAVTGMLAGDTQMMFTSPTSVIPMIHASRLKALAVTSPKRMAPLPDVPTLVESGIQGVEVSGWFALMAPAGTPQPIISRLNSEVVSMVASAEYGEQLAKQVYEPISSTPSELASFLKAEHAKWGRVIQTSKIK